MSEDVVSTYSGHFAALCTCPPQGQGVRREARPVCFAVCLRTGPPQGKGVRREARPACFAMYWIQTIPINCDPVKYAFVFDLDARLGFGLVGLCDPESHPGGVDDSVQCESKNKDVVVCENSEPGNQE